MTPQQLKAMELALSTLKEVQSETFRLLRNGQRLYAEEKVWNTIIEIKQALAEHAMSEVQRLGQEIEPDDIASILACRDMLDAQPVPPRTWVGSGDIENSNAYLTPPQRTEPPQKKVWTFWDLSGGDITDAIKAKIKEKNQ